MLAARSKEAEAMYIMKAREAEVAFLQKEKEAEAAYITRKKEADGLTEMAKVSLRYSIFVTPALITNSLLGLCPAW